jgi:TM2 domain-containing membrane protein YozV
MARPLAGYTGAFTNTPPDIRLVFPKGFTLQKLSNPPIRYRVLPTLYPFPPILCFRYFSSILVLTQIKSITIMDMFQNNPYMGLPGITPEELAFLQQATAELTENQQKYFYMNYTSKRKSPQDMLIFCIVGLCLVPGLQRFITGQVGMGLLYLFTAGLCFVGSIMDLVNHKDLAMEHNKKMAFESHQLSKMSN